MRFLLLNTDYPQFLDWLYARHPGLENATYDEQMQARNESLFGVADFFSINLKKLGHEAWDIHANNEPLQKAWAQKKNISWKKRTPEARAAGPRSPSMREGVGAPSLYLKSWLRPVAHWLGHRPPWFYEILAAQLRYYRPDVLLNHEMVGVSPDFLRAIKPHVKLIIGQHAAAPLPDAADYSCYDVVISSLPEMVEFFRGKQVPAELSGLGFEPAILGQLPRHEKSFAATFVGNLYDVHSGRIEWLEAICSRFAQARVWVPSIDHLAPNSPIRRCYAGPAWGREMYEVICRSRITLNHHANFAAHANNMRLYEATGVGTLLLTDWKENLPELFQPGREVAVYRNAEECNELIEYYLEYEEQREEIARCGQSRTLAEHTYLQRMRELVDIVDKYL